MDTVWLKVWSSCWVVPSYFMEETLVLKKSLINYNSEALFLVFYVTALSLCVEMLEADLTRGRLGNI